jgi:ParB-like nuclease family protein
MSNKEQNERSKVCDQRIVRLRIARIKVGANRRDHSDDVVNDTAVSIREVGLLNPITVARIGKNKDGNPTYSLVAGLLRLKAAERLGLERINAIILEGDKDQIRLSEIAENLFRSELTVLERSELIVEWLAIIRRKAAHGDQPGGNQPHDRGISKAARKLKLSRAMIGRSETIAGLSKDAKSAAKETKFDNSTKSLLAIAKAKTPAEQLGLLEEIRIRKDLKKAEKKKRQTEKRSKPPKEANSEVLEVDSPDTAWENDDELNETRSPTIEDADDADFFNLKAAWQTSPGFVGAWTAACLPARERFIKEILGHSTKAAASKTGAGT